MRTIKFRGKKLHNGNWVCGYLTDVDSIPIGKVGIINSKPFSGCEESSMVIAETIGQFTGLHDKNGKEIYEGDLLKVWCLPFADAEKEIAKVTWDEKRTGFILLYNNGSYHYFYDVMESEVIGNIHDTRNY